MQTRRQFLGKTAAGALGLTAFRDLLVRDLGAAAGRRSNPAGVSGFPGNNPKAKRVIFLFQAGAPSQIDLLDYKPGLKKWHGTDLPQSVKGDTKFTGMVNGQDGFPVVASPWGFSQYGKNGTWVSDLMPHLGSIVDEICIIKSVITTQVDHDNAITYMQTGHQLSGRPCAGAWLSYGLGSVCDDLPAFVVLVPDKGNAFLHDRHWGSGFLPSRYQGVRFGATPGEPVPFLNNPKGIDSKSRRRTLDDIRAFNALHRDTVHDPEIDARIAQYEMAFRMQTSVPGLTDVSDEPESILKLYGEDARTPGTYAYQCLLARRLAERGVRFTQVFQRGWDHHEGLLEKMPEYSAYTDRANAALVLDLKQRGMLDDTVVVWGGEFGRTVFSQGDIHKDNFGREHHPYVFTMWAAGGGFKPGAAYGESDDFSFRPVLDPVPVHDLYATLLHQLGIDHKALTYRFQGRDYRLTDLAGNVVRGLVA